MSDKQQELQRFIEQIRSGDNRVALAAVEKLRARGWLYDGSLTNADLSGADLSGSFLHRVNLREANLSHVNLRNSDLRGANLREANLNSADLKEADLTEAILTEATLSRTRLNKINLYRAILSKVNLKGANLTEAILRGANLTETILTEAALYRADLSGADLSRAILNEASLNEAILNETDLMFTILRNANLDNADLSNAFFGYTTLASIDLSYVKGLETVHHYAPSTVGTDTLFLSQGKIPEVFLREAGVHEDLITYLPSIITGKVIQYYSCFISHSSKDEEFCQLLHGRMRDAGLRVWFAPHDIRGGKKIHEQVDQAIYLHDKLILVLSEDSMNSNWVQYELRKAAKREQQERRRVFFPIRLVSMEKIENWEHVDSDLGKDLAAELRSYHIPDFSNWKDYDSFQVAFNRLIDDLRNSETKD